MRAPPRELPNRVDPCYMYPMLHQLTRTQTLPLSMEEAWPFFADPRNLCRITPPDLDFRITCPDPEPMYAGQILTYRVAPIPRAPFSTQWVTEITHMRAPHFFVDEQRLGPYRFWRHQHRFTEVEGGVVMEDIVHYALPLGPLGDLANAVLIKRLLARIFDYRAQTLAAMFGKAPDEVDDVSECG